MTAPRRVIVPGSGWSEGQYLVVDTERGMLRLRPGSAQHYALFVLGLNAALTLAGQRAVAAAGGGSPGAGAAEESGLAQLAADLQWHESVLIG